MKRFISIILAAVLAMATLVTVAGCGSDPKTLEDYLADNTQAEQQIEEGLSGLQNDDMDTSVSYEGNKIIITCNMKTTYEDAVLDALKKTFEDSMNSALEGPLETTVADIEEETGLSGVTIDVIINNGDGNQIWKGTYPKE